MNHFLRPLVLHHTLSRRPTMVEATAVPARPSGAPTFRPRGDRFSFTGSTVGRLAALLLSALAPLAALRGQSTYATPYAFTTFAGRAPIGSDDGTATAARFNNPYGTAVDGSGNIYVADFVNNTIRKITPGGVVSTLAGSALSAGATDGTGSTARFNGPTGLAVDAFANVYVADFYNDTIRKITPGGVVTTLAGTALSAGAVDGAGSAARFNGPSSVSLDTAGNVYVADLGNDTIRKITPVGTVTTFAGTALSPGATDGTGSAARFNRPGGLVVDTAGNVYVADTYNSTIRKITAGAVVTTLAGSAGSAGSADGASGTARFNYPNGVAVDSSGNIYVADTYNSTIRKITSNGAVGTLAGTAGSSGATDGTGSAARFNGPVGVALDALGNVYVADFYNDTIRKVASGQVVTTVAGATGTRGSTNATGGAARFNFPYGVAVTGAGNIYVADSQNDTIRSITPGGAVATFAGGVLTPGATDGTGTGARFNTPDGVAVDGSGNVYVADTNNHTIRKITPAGVATTFAGSALNPGSANGTGSAARFNYPSGVAVDSAGNVYVADTANHTIRKITPGGVVTTLAGLAGSFGPTDGTGSVARFYGPSGVAVDGSGNVYVADTDNDTIRKVTPAGVVTTLAGTGGIAGSADGTGAAARFYYPEGVAVDGSGNIFVADTYNQTIRKVTSAGVVTTLAGVTLSVNSADGTGSAARFNYPTSIAVDGSGTLYVADFDNSAIRKGVRPGAGNTGVPGDFNGDGKPDLLWENSTTGDNYIWLMDGTTFQSSVYLATLSTDWSIAGTGDFNGDGKTDLVWENASTGDRYFWLMNGSTFTSAVYLGNLAPSWHIAGTGDFNGDGQTDLVWENTSTGDRYVWLMNGTTFTSSVYLGNLDPSWRIAAIGDFNSDGKPDLVWENTSTGDRYIWIMNGTTFFSSVYLGNLAPSWHIAGTGDFNGDGKTDLIWENTSTGDRFVWLMNGTTFTSSVYLGNVATQWRIKP
jgi:streptogramin lyase